MSKLWKIVLLALPGSLAALGCASSEVVNYNNELVGITRDLENLGRDFGVQTGRNIGNPAKLREIHTETVKNSEAIIKRGKAPTPPNTNEGKALHQAFLAYLETEGEIIRVDFRTVAHLANSRDFAGVKSFLDRTQRKEQDKLNQLKAAQKTFAKANNMMVIQ